MNGSDSPPPAPPGRVPAFQLLTPGPSRAGELVKPAGKHSLGVVPHSHPLPGWTRITTPVAIILCLWAFSHSQTPLWVHAGNAGRALNSFLNLRGRLQTSKTGWWKGWRKPLCALSSLQGSFGGTFLHWHLEMRFLADTPVLASFPPRVSFLLSYGCFLLSLLTGLRLEPLSQHLLLGELRYADSALSNPHLGLGPRVGR